MNKVADTLNARDSNSFQQLVKLYENKQYKQGLKNTEDLLKRVPGHPETTSMKALFMYLNGSLEEGAQLAKQTLTQNLKSELCWHINGIIFRTQRNYSEAAKYYKSALRIAPDNQHILKDLSLLQIQTRDLDDLCDTRLKILLSKDSLIINWVSYMMALFLNDNVTECRRVLESVKKLAQELKPHETTELLFFELRLLRKENKVAEEVELLKSNEKTIVDKFGYFMAIVDALLALGKSDEAKTYIEELIKLNPENVNHYTTLQRAANLPQQPQTEDQKVLLEKFYQELQTKYKSEILKLQSLYYYRGDNFEQKFDQYIRPYFIKGLPSLFSGIKVLYKDENKVKLIEKVFLENLDSLLKNETFRGSSKQETPCCVLWNYMLLAQHYDFTQNQNKALQYINQAINHTPTLIELYLVRGKIYKHLFNFEKAYESVDQARQMDFADRYLNNKAIRYVLRLNQIEEADKLMRLFLRDATDGTPFDLQTMWYEISLGDAHYRNLQFPAVLKTLQFIEKHFSDMYEDQFDFHIYCMRKYNLKDYIEMIKFEDDINNNHFFIKGATKIIRTIVDYLPIREQQKAAQIKEEEQFKLLTATERKKLKKRQDREEEEEKERVAANPYLVLRNKLDLDGKELINQMKDPLDEVSNFARQLLEINIKDPKLAYGAILVLVEYYILKSKSNYFPFPLISMFLKSEKPLNIVRLLNKLKQVNCCPLDAHLAHVQALHFLQRTLESDANLNPLTQDIIVDALKTLGAESKSVQQFNDSFFATHKEKDLYREYISNECALIIGKFSVEENLIAHEQALRDLASNTSVDLAAWVFDQIQIGRRNKDILSKIYPQSDHFSERIAEKPKVEEKQE